MSPLLFVKEQKEKTFVSDQPYMISQIKVKLRFYSYISVIETSETIDSKWEIVARSINEDKLLTFNERTVNWIKITGQLSPNKVNYIILLTVLITVYSTDKGPLPTIFGRHRMFLTKKISSQKL